jgi:NitT/TauT family transport system substrate-binding protein
MGKINRRAVLRALGAAAATSLAGAVTVGPGIARAQGKGLVPVRFTGGANLGYTNLFVGEGAGIFKKHGIDAQVILFDVAFLGTEAVLAGQADTATTAGFPMINYTAKGADLVCPAVTITGDDIKIVVLDTIRKPEDFVGKKVGLILGSVAHYGFDRYVQHFKLPRERIEVINVAAAEQVALFAKGDLDAFIWTEPVVSRGLDLMKGRSHLMDPGLEVVMHNRNYLQMQRKWAEKNPDAVDAILRAHIEANDFIKTNVKEAAQFTGRKLNLPPDRIPELIRRAGYRWDVYLDAAQIAELKDVTGWMRDNKRLAAEPGDPRRVMAPEYLRKIAPASVVGL